MTSPLRPPASLPGGRRDQAGLALIEVLITIIILAFGLLGMAGLQGKALTAELESYQRAQAIVLAQDMVDRIQARRKSAASYVFSGYVGDSYSHTCPTASPTNPVATDCNAWHNLLLGSSEKVGTSNRGAMIGARGCVTVDANNVYTVTVTWQGTAPTAAPANNACAQNTYGDDALRRAYSIQFRIATQT